MVKDKSDQKQNDFQLRSEAEAKLTRAPLPDAPSRPIEELHAKEDAEQISSELAAYIKAIGELALLSVTDRSGRILRVNAKFCEVSGYSEAELIGQNHRILNSGMHPKAFFTEMWATIARGEVWHHEVCNRNKQGQLYWVDSTIVPLKDKDGKIERYLSVRVDITDRKAVEAEILALNENLEHLVIERTDELLHAKEGAEQISSELAAHIKAIGELALLALTDHSGRILRVNSKFCEVSGYSEAELIGQNHRILNSGMHPKAFFTEMWATIARGEVWHQEVCNRNKQGQLYWVDSTIVPLKDKAGKVNCYLSVRVDITARKQAEGILRERLKEITCFYEIRRCMTTESPLEEVCRIVLEQLVTAMQFSDIATAVIELDGRRFTSGEYSQDLAHGLQATIIVSGKAHGQLQLFYREDKPFLLPEEQKLVDVIASDLGRWLERKRAEQHILEMATHDLLTGLPNRNLLLDRIAQILAHDRRSQEQAAVLFIDLDHFKIINDSLGHDVGDLLLQEVAARLITAVRDEDTVARRGGDEFIVLLPNITGPQDAETVAQKILDGLMQPYFIHRKELHIGGSIGIALFPDDGKDVETLLKSSDIAMYHAKESGRNNYQFFSPEMNRRAMERHSLGVDLRHALERNELLLYFQPVIDMPGGRLTGMEVLLRWQHSKQGLIPPSGFIPLAEETGMIVPIGEWVLRQSCLRIKAWQSQGYDVPKLAVNLSAEQFRQKTLVADIARILAETGVEANCLVLEITESMLVENVEETTRTLQQLSALGLEISIDDFGTGYSSLSYLKRYPINTLKIDRSFVRDIATNPNDAAIVKAIIAMAHSLKMEVVAEGVETEEQLAFLTRQGCGRFQGNYFSRPLPSLEAESRLQIH